jgi:uncharacterized repeat protein (TIGR01451 family)
MRRVLAAAALTIAFGLAAAAAAAASVPVGTLLRNVAEVRYSAGSAPRQVASNEVTLRVEAAASSAAITLARLATSAAIGTPGDTFNSPVGPTQCSAAGAIVNLEPPFVTGTGAVDPAQPQWLSGTETVHAGDAVFVRVVDPDQNHDAAAVDFVDVRVSARATGDSETLRLRETGVDTGVFTGYIGTRIAASAAADCQLQVARDSLLDAAYVDPLDPRDAVKTSGLVDPYGMVFDSSSGQRIDGARVRLVDALTGAPAPVRGDDGVSSYPSEMITGQPVTDSGGTTYTMPRGVYRFPLVAPGRYRLVIEPPAGYLFTSTASADALQKLQGAPFRLAAASFGEFFVVVAPVLAAVDVPLDPGSTSMTLRKSASTTIAAVGDLVAYDLDLGNESRSAPLRTAVIEDHLPPGVRYRRGSLRIDGRVAPDPVSVSGGRVLQIPVGTLAPAAHVRLRYVTEVTVAASGRELINTAQAIAAGDVHSNEAQARVQLRNELFAERSFLVGRVVTGECGAAVAGAPGVEGVRVYLEDGRYALTDREGKYHFEGLEPGSHVVQLDVATLPDGLAPQHCDATVQGAGRDHSQFVALRAGTLARADFRLAGTRAAHAAARVAALVAEHSAGGAAAAAGTGRDASGPSASAVEPDIEALEPGVRFLSPEEGATPPIASLKVALVHGPRQRVQLRINGTAVSILNYDGATSNAARSVALSRWRGIDLRDGANEIVAIVSDVDGGNETRLVRHVHYGGGPVRAEFDTAASTLVADGRTRPVIVLRLFDAYGQPARAGTMGVFRVQAPYRTWQEVQALDDNPLLAVAGREPRFEVEAGGVARLELEPTTQAGRVALSLRFNERRTQDLQAWLEPAARDWIMVGIASGTKAWSQVSKDMEPLPPTLADGAGADDADRVAFFAKGRIRGDALLTLAYDSARDPRAARQRLNGVIEPDRYYMLYGDGAEPRYEAASAEKLFIKLERRQFVALFGDFDTGLTVTELARYSRSLTGLKAEYGGERVGVTAFAARTDLGAVHDELRGDGTSGLYRLSRAPLVIGSDKLRIEVRDRFRGERVLQSKELARFLDYRLDATTGEIFFKEPVPSRDAEFNPVYIVADYETVGTGEERTTAGTRASLRSTDGRIEVGASVLSEGAMAGDTQLGAADLKWRLDPVTEVRAELARSRSDDPARADAARAWLAEINHVTERLEARAWLREQQAGFGVGQQMSSESGTRKAGFEARVSAGEHWQFQGEGLLQESLGTAARRQLASGEVRYRRDIASGALGLRHVGDELSRGEKKVSDQAFATGSVDLFDRRVTLRLTADAALGGRDDSVDYPSRTLLGVDYHLRQDVALFTEWEHADGGVVGSDMTRVGLRARPWERTELVSSLNQASSESGPRTFANFGLTQGFRLNERWSFDLGLDQSNTLRGTDTVPLLNAQTPLASGSTSEDFLATFVGAQYHDEAWTLTGRAERRSADSERRTSLLAGWYREQSAGHSLSLTFESRDSVTPDTTPDTRSTNLRFAWAWRPVSSEWIVFNRTDLIREQREGLSFSSESLRWVDNLHANWQAAPGRQLGLQLGLRHVISEFDGERYRGLATLLGADLRQALPLLVFGRPLDVGLHAARLGSPKAGVTATAVGLDVGFTPARNVWLSVGYNFTGFVDRDFGSSRQTARGVYLAVRIKADQDTFRDLRLDSLRPSR